MINNTKCCQWNVTIVLTLEDLTSIKLGLLSSVFTTPLYAFNLFNKLAKLGLCVMSMTKRLQLGPNLAPWGHPMLLSCNNRLSAMTVSLLSANVEAKPTSAIAEKVSKRTSLVNAPGYIKAAPYH